MAPEESELLDAGVFRHAADIPGNDATGDDAAQLRLLLVLPLLHRDRFTREETSLYQQAQRHMTVNER